MKSRELPLIEVFIRYVEDEADSLYVAIALYLKRSKLFYLIKNF